MPDFGNYSYLCESLWKMEYIGVNTNITCHSNTEMVCEENAFGYVHLTFVL